jgi:penicillin-binding protein 1A
MRFVLRLLFLLFPCWLMPGLEHRFEHELVPDLDQELEGIDSWRPPTSVRVYDKGGEEIDAFSLVRREWLSIDEVAPAMWQAVVSAEDRRFFDHRGVDLQGIARAAFVNLRAGTIREGGSTLTQQLVKNLVVGAEKSYQRKIREALLAWRLEQKLDKKRILELYLNFIYLGSGNYGVETAAHDYFGVSARDLEPGQAALLAGLIPAPSAYSPRRNADIARKRRGLVLDAMVEEGWIDVIVGQEQKRQPVDPPRREAVERADLGTAYVTTVRREVRRLLGEEVPFQAGLQVHTPFDPELQAVAEEAVRRGTVRVQKRHGHPGRLRRIRHKQIAGFLAEAPGLEDRDGHVLLPEVGDCFPGVALGGRVVLAGPFAFRFDLKSWQRWVRNHDYTLPPGPLGITVRYGDVYRVCYAGEDYVTLPDEDWVEAAAAVVENATGNVVALVGGRDVPLEGFVRATQGLRQAGSSFKPYVYAAALESGMTQIDTVLDAPINLGGWQPRNSSGGYSGQMPMRSALAFSVNTVAVRLALRAGADRVVELAHAAGIRSRLRRDLTLALGSSEVSVLDQAAGISTFTRMGRAIPPVFVTRLVDYSGNEVGRAGDAVQIPGVDLELPGPPGVQVMDPGTAWQILDMMRGVVRFGTGGGAHWPGRDRGGKTGTTSGFADAWFVGFTSTHTITVWVGQDERVTLGKGEAGSRAALPIWREIADAIPHDPDVRLRPPPDVVLIPWMGQWVGISADDVSQARLPWNDAGEAPLPPFPADKPKWCPDDGSAALEP